MLRALFRRKSLKTGEDLARFEAKLRDVAVTQLSEYQNICGFTESDIVLMTMPQSLRHPARGAFFPDFPHL